VREVLPNALIPATTALGSIAGDGREQGILQGANVVMPNISPPNTRDKYLLYDGKICTEENADECIPCLKRRLLKIGCELVVDRGDYAEKNSQLIPQEI
jgi:biotin synthase